MITREQLERALPKQLATKVDQVLVDKINSATTDPGFSEQLREGVIGYTSVLKDGRYKIEDYVNAVKYNSYLAMGDKRIVAWAKTFPARYQKLKVAGAQEKVIYAHSSMYKNNKLVNAVYEQMLIPSHILNANVFQDAINTQAQIMKDPDVSPKVRSGAADSLMTHLKRPEAQKVELDLGVKDDSVIRGLKDITVNLASQMQQMIGSGAYSVKEISNMPIIIEGETEDA